MVQASSAAAPPGDALCQGPLTAGRAHARIMTQGAHYQQNSSYCSSPALDRCATPSIVGEQVYMPQAAAGFEAGGKAKKGGGLRGAFACFGGGAHAVKV